LKGSKIVLATCILHVLLLLLQKFTPESIEFQAKILARSGLGDETSLPPGLAQQPPAISMKDARWEFEQVNGHWRRLLQSFRVSTLSVVKVASSATKDEQAS
jgi:hypothetical protein